MMQARLLVPRIVVRPMAMLPRVMRQVSWVMLTVEESSTLAVNFMREAIVCGVRA